MFMFSSTFCARVLNVLGNGRLLRERQAQRAAISPSMSYGRHFGPPSPTAKQAAVMVLIEGAYDTAWTSWSIPLTVRPNHLPSHPGQISLPGGRREAGETLEETACRELQEELGLATFPGRVLGALQPLYVYNSDYYVTPFMAYSQRLPQYEPCRDEVERVIQLPLGLLHDRGQDRVERFTRGLMEWTAPVVGHADELIWGATAIILAEVRVVIDAVMSERTGRA